MKMKEKLLNEYRLVTTSKYKAHCFNTVSIKIHNIDVSEPSEYEL